jgi:type II secretory pathway pseudopilin PulG
VLVLVVLGGIAALVVPAIDRGKDSAARRERARHDAAVARELARLRADQRPHFGTTRARSPARIEAALSHAITRDARARARAGALDPPIRHTDCERGLSGGVDPRTGRAVFTCTAVRHTITGVRGVQAAVGYSFVASADFRRGDFCWCKINPLPSEHNVSGIPHVRPSRLCAGPLRRVL